MGKGGLRVFFGGFIHINIVFGYGHEITISSFYLWVCYVNLGMKFMYLGIYTSGCVPYGLTVDLLGMITEYMGMLGMVVGCRGIIR